MRKRYDNQLKLIYNLGMEKMLVADEIRSKIPKSTASTWRSLSMETMLNSEYSEEVRSTILSFIEVKEEIVKRDKKTFFTLMRFKIFLEETIGKKNIERLLKKNKKDVVRIMSQMSDSIDKKGALKLLGITPRTYKKWQTDIKYFCTSSVFHNCARSKPQQLTINEVDTLKKLLVDPEKSHWSISSIHGDAFKGGQIGFSLATAYRYNKQFGFREKQAKGKKRPYRPLRASVPNEIWHADISIFKTDNGKKYYIYAVIDNYSRKILAWNVSNKSSARLSTRVLRSALYSCKIRKLQYITDGGRENDNWTIKEFLRKHHASINHTIALRDIIQSNSMVESVFRTMKSNYLYLRKTKNKSQLIKVMQHFVYEYNDLKPHFSMGFYTPSEIYLGNTNSVDVSGTSKRAFNDRINSNKTCSCRICICCDTNK